MNPNHLEQDVTEENAELLLGSKANQGLLSSGLRLRHTRSGLPVLPYYPMQRDAAAHSTAPPLEPLAEGDDMLESQTEKVWFEQH